MSTQHANATCILLYADMQCVNIRTAYANSSPHACILHYADMQCVDIRTAYAHNMHLPAVNRSNMQYSMAIKH